MSQNWGIICFKHCNDSSIFCKNVPTICPLCKSVVSRYILEPFELPNPFGEAAQNPCSIAVGPSCGNFLQDYNPGDDLHIGITSSKGEIFEFDKRGLVINNFSKWSACLSFSAVPESWNSHWDAVLLDLCNNPKWKSYNYHPTFANCFNFVIDFFQALNYADLKFLNKQDLCELFILPKLQDALRYISLHRNLKFNDYYAPSIRR